MSWTFYNATGEVMITHAESKATQAEIEGETAVAKFVPPDLVKNSPGVAKAYGSAIANGTEQANSYNISGVVRDSLGNYTWSFDDVMGNVNFSAVGNVEDSQYDWRLDTPLVGSVQVHTRLQDGSAVDAIHNITVHGDQ
jgi:hypothetical protein